MRLLTHQLTSEHDPAVVFATLFADHDHPWWLDSALPGGELGRYSYLGSAQGPLARIALTEYGRPGVVVRSAGGVEVVKQELLDFIADDLVAHMLPEADLTAVPGGFRLGWVGYLGYELGARLVTGLDRPDETAQAVLVFADRAAVIDHQLGELWLMALADDATVAQQEVWFAEAETELANAQPATPAAELPEVPADAIAVRHERTHYLDLVEECRELIAAGESYELCLTNRVSVLAQTDPWQLYRRLRQTSPRPFGAYLAFDRGHVLSASPERFLSVNADGWAEAKPIKGTRPRGATLQQDAALVAELAADEKERAENLMIVDLLRNDLGRVCRTGTVHVPKLFDVETYAGVHHLVSTVRGHLRDDVTAVDAVRAALPGGSMTGAPKHRSIQLLHRLEAGPRGVYSGAIGYFSLDGAADWSIVIRSIVWHPDHLTYGMGGAVTAGSNAEAEWTETIVKARTLGTALGVDLDGVLPVASQPVATTWRWAGQQCVQFGHQTAQNAHVNRAAAIDGDLLVADSWRVVNGRTHHLDRHRDRFVAAVRDSGVTADEVAAFWHAALHKIPQLGEWFPRVRLVQKGSELALVLDLRPGPPRVETARVRVLPPGDPRYNPRIKGPDLALAGQLIAESGTEEVLVRDVAGRVLEAGYSAVVWWRGDELWVPSEDLAVLPSVTRQWVIDRGLRLGYRVHEAHATVADLDGCEAWLLNAYQGIRLITTWQGADITAGPGMRFAQWRNAWLTV